MRTLALAVLTWLVASSVGAQAPWFELPVPTASLAAIRVDLSTGTSMALERAVRVLHAVPREGDPLPQVVEFERLLLALDADQQEAQRLGQRGLSLAMSGNSSERDVLQDVLKVLGFRLRERRGMYSVEADREDDAVALRKLLASAGVDTTTLESKLNRGETVTLAPAVTPMPSPLSLDTWGAVVFERPVPPRSVFSAIVRDRQASLLLLGLSAMTPETRAFFSRNRELLRRLYRDNAAAVAAFGDAFQVDSAGTIVLPGGTDALQLWDGLVDEKAEQVDRFARALFDRDGGRLGYFVQTLSRLDAPHLKFALGLWIADPGVRLERFRTLYRTFVDVDTKWSVAVLPFARPLFDPAMLLSLVRVEPNGAPAMPAYRRLWDKALDGIDAPSPGAREVGEAARDGLVDAAWLAERTRLDLFGERRLLTERIAFGQRVFAKASEAEMEDVLTALRGFGRFPAILLAAERIGVRSPAVLAQLARRARELEDVTEPETAVPLLGQFQGALAILERLARTGAIETTRLEALVRSLSALPTTEGRYNGTVAGWLTAELLPALGGKAESTERPLESDLTRGLADRGEVRAFEWEGAFYVADVTRASLADLAFIRTKQGGNSLDDVLALWTVVQALEEPRLTIDAIKQATAALKLAGTRMKPLRPWPDLPEDVPDFKKILDRAIRDLGRITKPKDAEKTPRAVRPVVRLVDSLLAEILVAFAYAPWLGDPSELLGPQADLSHRHSFGFGKTSGAVVERRAWQRTALDSSREAGAGFAGSLLSLDLIQAAKRLRRLSKDSVPTAPRLNPNDSDALTEALALMNPRELTTPALTTLGEAVAQGRELVRSTKDAAELDKLATRISMPGNRRQALSWAALAEPGRAERLFSMSELLWLGLGDETVPTLDAWGTTSEPVSGCFCLRFPSRNAWDVLAGRPGARLLGAAVTDVTLRVAEHLAALQVPAALAPGVIAMATQGFIDTAPPLYDDDWVGVVGHAHGLARETVEDYVAALVASGPVRPVSAGDPAP